MDLEEFTNFYKQRGYLPNDFGRRSRTRPLTEAEISRRFQALQKTKIKNKEKLSEERDYEQKDSRLRAECARRDKNRCRLRSLLSPQDALALSEAAGPLAFSLDMAHVFGKGSHSWMRYDLDNVVLLNRYSHAMLDTGRHPITGKPISLQERENWWRYIVDGSADYDDLKRRASQRGSIR